MANMIEQTATLPPQVADVRVRAGFWRRVVAFLIDTLIVTVVIQLLVACLFFATSGRVQILGDLNYTTCTDLKTVPDELAPPPPAGVNYARECNITFFRLPTAKILQVGQTAEQTSAKAAKEKPKVEIKKTYLLDRDGRQVDGTSLEWFAGLALILYIIAMETRSGATLGSRAMGIRVIDAAMPAGFGVPLRKVLSRYAAMLIGVVPIVFVMAIYFGLYAAPGELSAWLTELGQSDPLFGDLKSNALQWQPFLSSYLFDLPASLPRAVDLGNIAMLFDTAALALNIWVIVLIVQIVRRRDPAYDRIADTSVVMS